MLTCIFVLLTTFVFLNIIKYTFICNHVSLYINKNTNTHTHSLYTLHTGRKCLYRNTHLKEVLIKASSQSYVCVLFQCHSTK